MGRTGITVLARSEQGTEKPQWIKPENSAFGRRKPFSRFDCASRIASVTYLSAISLCPGSFGNLACRNERFREGDVIRRVFERVVEAALRPSGWRRSFAVDASLIQADVNKQRSIAGQDWRRDRDPARSSRAVKEYLATSTNRRGVRPATSPEVHLASIRGPARLRRDSSPVLRFARSEWRRALYLDTISVNRSAMRAGLAWFSISTVTLNVSITCPGARSSVIRANRRDPLGNEVPWDSRCARRRRAGVSSPHRLIISAGAGLLTEAAITGFEELTRVLRSAAMRVGARAAQGQGGLCAFRACASRALPAHVPS